MRENLTKVNLVNAYSLSDLNIKRKSTYRFFRRFFVFLVLIKCSNGTAQKQSADIQDAIYRVNSLIDNFQLQEAHRMCDSILDIGYKRNDKDILGTVYNSKGSICREENDVIGAIDCFRKSIEFSESTKNEKRLAQSYVNLGSIYNYIEETKTALSYYYKAIKILQNKKDYYALGILYNNIGNIYLDQKQIVSADYNFRKALQVSNLITDSLNLARVYHNLGNCKMIIKQRDSALKFYNNSLNYLSKYEEGLGHLYNFVQIASLYLELNNTTQAQTYLTKALAIAQKAESTEDLLSIYSLLSKAERLKHNDKKAYDYLFIYTQLSDSLKGQDIKDHLIKLQYETDLKTQKKEQELTRKNQEAINQAKLESKNKSLYLSYSALGFAVIMGILILNGYRQKQKANKIISKQKEEVEQKNSEILASINYAKRIQYALLAHKEFMEQYLPTNFIYFDPKDIVSGDFYWAAKRGTKIYLAVCDSTGHGVPGAFMCLLNIGFLSEAINEKGIEEPNKIFDHVRQRLIESISKEGQKDGFDGILLCVDQISGDVTYAAANNAPIHISNGAILELEKDKMPVGIGEKKDAFKLHSIKPNAGDMLYLYTDGYADQFGGPKGKKYKYKQLNERLLEWSTLDMEAQRYQLANEFKSWKGSLEQVDDVCVIGIRF